MLWKVNHILSSSIDEDKIIEQLLKIRNISAFDDFITPPHPHTWTLDTFGYGKQLAKILSLLKPCFETKQPIIIYTDYDCDGITGGAILWETLHELGFKAIPYVPNRHTDGYGFNKKTIEKLIDDHKPGVIISVDHGVTGHEVITYAQSRGVPVIVTDHHAASATLPNAQALIHIPQLSGSSVAYVVAHELARNLSSFPSVQAKLEKYFLSDYLAFAAIGLIADLVPVTGFARSIAFHGLKALRTTDREGLTALMDVASVQREMCSEWQVGFHLAPRINAIGRLGHAIDALRLLCTHNPTTAHTLAEKLQAANIQRQKIVEESLKEALVGIDAVTVGPVITIASDTWNEGIIGLLAAKLTEKFNRPTIVATKNNDIYKASVRSLPGIDITSFLRSLNLPFISLGGHSGAGGFSIANTDVDMVFTSIQQAAVGWTPSLEEKTLEIDIQLPLGTISQKLVHLLDTLRPFGPGNHKPIFSSKVSISRAKRIGKNGNHASFVCSSADCISPLSCIAFQYDSGKPLPSGETEIAYSLENNVWNGRTKIQANIVDIQI